MNLSNRSAKTGMLFIAIAASLWGLDGVVLTPRLGNLNVVFVVFLLHAIPFLLMNVFLFPRYKAFKKLSRKNRFSLLAVSVFGGALGTIAIVKALFLVNFRQLSVVVLLQKFQPVFAIILVAIFLKEKLSRSFILWASVAIIAGYFLTFGWSFPDIESGSHNIQAMLLSLFAAFSFGSSTVFSKNLLEKIDFVTATFFRYGFTFLLMLPVVVFSGLMFSFTSVTPVNWLIIGIITLTTGSGAILLYYHGLKHTKASYATLLELFFPISAIFFDYYINGNVLSPIQWISAVVMIFAIIRATVSQ